tara:strand:+ start:257 stop:490 length:234 start_codon:yes stop_codon:yes gene_type:complete
MSNYTPVEGRPGLYRDEDSNAVINRNSNDYQAYMSRKQVVSRKNNELKKMKEDLDTVKDEMSEIKSLLVSLNQKLNT